MGPELPGPQRRNGQHHSVSVTMVKSYEPIVINNSCSSIEPILACANPRCSKASNPCVEHVVVETCDDNIASENEKLKQEVERLREELTVLKGKGCVQPAQDNHDDMVNKLEEGSNCAQPLCSCYWCKEKGHNVQACLVLRSKLVSSTGSPNYPAQPTGLSGDAGLSGRQVPDYPVKPVAAQASTSKAREDAQSHNKVGKDKAHMNKAVNEPKGFRQRICYNYRQKGHLGKDCPYGNFTHPNLINKRIKMASVPKSSSGEPKVISSLRASH